MDSFNRILVIRLSAMGDIILTTPVLRWIKKHYPESRLDVLVKSEYRTLLENHPDVNQVHSLPSDGGLKALFKTGRFLRGQQYDAVADLQASSRSRWLARQSGASEIAHYRPWRRQRFFLVHFKQDLYSGIQPVPLRYLETVESWGIRDAGGGTSLFLSDAVRDKADRVLSDINPKRMVVLAPGAGRVTKQWPADRFAAVGKGLQKQGYELVFTGGKSDRHICEQASETLPGKSLNLAGRLSMIETAAVLEKSRLLITNDTGVMHMAGAVQTAVVAIFGPTTEKLGFFPFRSESRIVEIRDLKCRPCSFHGSKRCPRRHFRCMREITSEAVLRAAESILHGE